MQKYVLRLVGVYMPHGGHNDTEVDAVYSILGNLTRVVRGERYVIDPFLDAYPQNRKGEPQFLSTSGIVRALKAMLAEVGHDGVGELLDWFFVSGLRNAFSHADYTLHEDEFRCRSELFEIGGIRTPVLKLDLLVQLFNRALTFHDVFMQEYHEQRGAYRSNKVLLGRFAGDEPAPIELLADSEGGLYGFRAPPEQDAGE